MIDNWDGSHIDQVKVELFRKGTLDVEIYFDGRGSTSSDWFTKERLRSNSFNDLNQMSAFNFFSVDGHLGRHFYISHIHSGCPNDKGWIVVIDKDHGSSRICEFDRIPGKAYPYILYGTDHHMIKFATEAAVADMMIISISTLV
ncbi:uncharacterized protein LOC127710923 [Mytilus californianus]|uniref:uncharacterized protein LOC127710923 n=1 Tax=Mytilus californianus TaxID=6549 RepID=UPI0022459DBB|nr:uncharacterized protein LOC127710923 [Mytilus californianus]